jgi:hypothetical protein
VAGSLRACPEFPPTNLAEIRNEVQRFLLRFAKHLASHTMTNATTPSRFGFVAFAETWNGRLAMLGFVIGLGTELLTGQGILSQIGLS